MRFLFSVSSTLALFLFLLPLSAAAQSASELQAQINQHNSQISSLQAEIDQYQVQLDAVGKQKNTLQSTINGLTIQQKQLTAQIAQTQDKISSANLEIKRLTLSIGSKEMTIAGEESAVAKALNEISQMGDNSLIVQLFDSEDISDAWSAIDDARQFNEALNRNIAALKSARQELSDNRDEVTATKQQLVSLQAQLATQKKSIDASKATQQTLLTQTKNQESNYQKLIAQKQAAQKAFENELATLESQLNLIVNPGSLPKVGSGVLQWPVPLSFMNQCAKRKSVFGNLYCITQYFGNTAFATANAQIYNGKGHDAIDIGTPIGTPILASRSGKVVGTGNTDAIPGCYSFGKWVMVEHGNGLNTMYAHLSVIEVSKGQNVGVGQELGLSGMTGYSTGPHLHYGVYATQGTKIMDLGAWRGTGTTPCTRGGAIIPVATADAYLNPLSYL